MQVSSSWKPLVRMRIITGALCLLAWTVTARSAAADEPGSPCATLTAHKTDTVITFEPPSTFTICRDGAAESDVVTDRRVYFELLPSPGATMFDFRLHGHAAQTRPTGLLAWQEQSARIALGLDELDHSSEAISAIAIPLGAPPGPSPLAPLAAARARYSGLVTPRFLETLDGLRSEIDELPVIADVVRRWCGELQQRGNALVTQAGRSELRTRCAAPELGAGAIERANATFLEASAELDASRRRTRDLVIAAVARADDAQGVAAAVQALDEARLAASKVTAAARALRPLAKALSRDATMLRDAIASTNTLRPGEPTYLTTYGSGGTAVLEVDAEPRGIAAAGEHTAQQELSTVAFHFPIVERHYLDIEAGLAVTGGLPAIPTLATQGAAGIIQGKPVDEFAAMALVELEPLRFLWPDRPLAGVFRLPVLGVPLTRNPTQNFFIGAGLGWTGVGSISAGPYLLRELTLRDGYALDQPLPAGTSFAAATEPAVQVGYFVSASIDLVGLFHVFVPVHTRSIDAATGKEK